MQSHFIVCYDHDSKEWTIDWDTADTKFHGESLYGINPDSPEEGERWFAIPEEGDLAVADEDASMALAIALSSLTK